MIILELGQHLLHYSLPVETGFFVDMKLLAEHFHCLHFPVIQIHNLPVTPYERRFLLFQILRINCLRPAFPFLCHDIRFLINICSKAFHWSSS